MPEQSFDSSGPVKRPSGGSPDVWEPAAYGGDAFDSSGAVVLIIDADGIVRAFNRKATEHTGLSREAAVGKEIFPLLFPDSLQELARVLLLEDLKRYGELTGILLQVMVSDGRKLPVKWDFCAQRDGSGNLAGVVCIGRVAPEMAGLSTPCVNTGQLVHDILNHNHVAMGYLELAMEQVKPGNELQPMLKNVYTALRRSSDLTLDVYHASRNCTDRCGYAIQAGLTARK